MNALNTSSGPRIHDSGFSIQCVILLGGLGTRLRPIVENKPKALADINEKPFLYYQICFLAKNGVKEIVLCTGYMGDKIRYYIKEERKKLDSLFRCMNFKFSHEGNDLLGTGGALKRAHDLLNDRFFLLNGDSLFLSDLDEITRHHLNSSSDLTIGLTEARDSKRYGSVILENGNKKFSKVLSFFEKEQTNLQPRRLPIVNAGLYLIEKRSINWQALPDKFSLEKDLLPLMVSKCRIFGFLDRGSYFIDMGTPDGYKKLQEDIATNKIEIDL